MYRAIKAIVKTFAKCKPQDSPYVTSEKNAVLFAAKIDHVKRIGNSLL